MEECDWDNELEINCMCLLVQLIVVDFVGGWVDWKVFAKAFSWL